MRKVVTHSIVVLLLMLSILVALSCQKKPAATTEKVAEAPYTCDYATGQLSPTVVIQCGPKSLSVLPDKVCVSPGYSVSWDFTTVAAGTPVEITLFNKISGPANSAADPIDSWSSPSAGKRIAKVKDTAEGQYKYTVKCGSKALDPIIDVPPKK